MIRLATTTSTENSGLLSALLPPFDKKYRADVQVIAVGTGKALELGRRGDVDVILVHDPAREKAFVAAGHGVNRRELMYNDFVLVGPPSDPAGAAAQPDVLSAFRTVASSRASFVSRDDRSGTHSAELRLWKAAGTRMTGKRYIQAGVGMAQALLMASEKRAYTLSDRGTFLAVSRRLELKVLSRSEPILRNPYAVIAVNPIRNPGVNHVGAMALIGYLTSSKGQRRIGAFKFRSSTLFHPLLFRKRR